MPLMAWVRDRCEPGKKNDQVLLWYDLSGHGSEHYDYCTAVVLLYCGFVATGGRCRRPCSLRERHRSEQASRAKACRLSAGGVGPAVR